MAYDPTTPHSLLARAEAIAKHIGSVAVGLGHEGVLKLEQLVGLEPTPEPVEAAPAAPAAVIAATPQQDPDEVARLQTALDQLHQERGRIEDLLTKSSSQARPADVTLPDFAFTVITDLQVAAIDRGNKLITANDANVTLTKQLAAANEGIDSKTAEITTLRQAAGALQIVADAKDATIAGLEATVSEMTAKTPAPVAPPVDNAHVAPGAEPFSAETIALNAAATSGIGTAPVDSGPVDTAPGVVADVTEPSTIAPSRESPVT